MPAASGGVVGRRRARHAGPTRLTSSGATPAPEAGVRPAPGTRTVAGGPTARAVAGARRTSTPSKVGAVPTRVRTAVSSWVPAMVGATSAVVATLVASSWPVGWLAARATGEGWIFTASLVPRRSALTSRVGGAPTAPRPGICRAPTSRTEELIGFAGSAAAPRLVAVVGSAVGLALGATTRVATRRSSDNVHACGIKK